MRAMRYGLTLRFTMTALAVTFVSGCATARQTNTARSAVEQLLISSAVDDALDKVDFRPFSGANVYLNEKYVDCQDKNYVIASVRHRLLSHGARLIDDAEKAEIVVEMRAGSVGTDMSESFLGTPEIVLPGMMTIPEVKMLTNNKQTATAKIGLVAYDYRNKSVLGSGGMTTAVSNDSRWTIMGVGLPKSGSIHRELADATTGTNRKKVSTLPAKVAFSAPPSPAGIKYAGGQKKSEAEDEPAVIEPAANWSLELE